MNIEDTVFMWQIIAAILFCLLILVCRSFIQLLNDYNDVMKSRNEILRESNKKLATIVSLEKQIKELKNG